MSRVHADLNLTELFRRLYYFLYSNGQASRAERIVEDMTLVLLSKLAVERVDDQTSYNAVLDGGDPDILLELVHREFPEALREGERFNNDSESIRHSLRELKGVMLSGAPAHIIGDAFQAVMGPRVRGDKGQFFTPRSVVRAMVEIVNPRPGESVLDPAAGSGGFLAEAYAHQLSEGGPGKIVGLDKDFDLYRLMTAMLAIVAGPQAEARNRNSLDLEEWRQDHGVDSELFDVVLTNPPFGARIGVSDQRILAEYDFGHNWVKKSGSWTKTSELASSRDPQIMFLELCVRLLKPGGRLGIVLPEGVFGNSSSAYVWSWLRERGSIEALLDCPRTTFQPGTDTKTNVLFFVKGELQGPTRVATALSCGHDRRGRTVRADGTRYPDDFETLADDYAKSDPELWSEVDLGTREYLVPRYYEAAIPRDEKEQAIVDGATWVTLQDLVDAGELTVRKGHEPGSEAYGTGDIPFIRTSDIGNFEIHTDPTKSVSEATYDKFQKSQNLRAGDVLMVVDGRYRIGSAAMVSERTRRSVVQSHLRILSLSDSSRLDSYALLYALTLPSVRRRVRDLVFVQSTLGTLGKRVLELEIPLLVGDGPWLRNIDEFRNVLQQRDVLLGKLNATAGGDEFEL
ncbi:N-6 DNA methylase [Salinibacterium sp. dk2585]|nr:N-6 DNA methylase [Salinibacterium sp. dk2585]TXK52322.1 N-6 DNA methylase [Salinibacterium sp. dk5596]